MAVELVLSRELIHAITLARAEARLRHETEISLASLLYGLLNIQFVREVLQWADGDIVKLDALRLYRCEERPWWKALFDEFKGPSIPFSLAAVATLDSVALSLSKKHSGSNTVVLVTADRLLLSLLQSEDDEAIEVLRVCDVDIEKLLEAL